MLPTFQAIMKANMNMTACHILGRILTTQCSWHFQLSRATGLAVLCTKCYLFTITIRSPNLKEREWICTILLPVIAELQVGLGLLAAIMKYMVTTIVFTIPKFILYFLPHHHHGRDLSSRVLSLPPYLFPLHWKGNIHGLIGATTNWCAIMEVFISPPGPHITQF